MPSRHLGLNPDSNRKGGTMSADPLSRPRDTMTVTRRIVASPGMVFAVLANPTTHADVHGTGRDENATDTDRIGRVNGALDTEPITGAGQTFRMSMYHEQHPNKNYETINEVLVYEPSSAIAWRTGYLNDHGVAEFGGWLWRYDLTPTDRPPSGGSETDVTLTYDWSAATQEARDVINFPPFGPERLRDSLAHLADIVAKSRQ
jgi:hypothetical protein